MTIPVTSPGPEGPPQSSAADLKHAAGVNDPAGATPPDSIVFFDGVCGFCNASVNGLMARDRRRRLKFAPLQGLTARKLLPPEFLTKLDTLVFLHCGRTFVRSAAAVRILWTVGGGAAVAAALLWLVPRPLRDFGYRIVARVRYRLFGKHETCRLPTAEERGLILE